MGYVVTSPPATEPVTLEVAKAHLRVTYSIEDDLINALITAAREYVERRMTRSLITQTWRLDLDNFPAARRMIRINHGPVQSITSVKYLDQNAALQTLATDQYLVDLSNDVATIQPPVAQSWFWPNWPGPGWSQPGGVQITFVAGYGDDPDDVPAAIRQAMLLLIGHWFAHREAVAVEGRIVVAEVPMAADALLGLYTVPALA